MYYRPISLLILGILHLLEPFAKFLYYGLVLSDDFNLFLKELSTTPPLELASALLLFPLAGIAILAVKSWSLPVFLSIEAFVLISNYSFFKGLFLNGHYLHLSFLLFFVLLNIFVVSVVLIPAVRIFYTNPRLRWWEAYPRYHVEIEGMIENNDKILIHDISKTGMFISTDRELVENDIVGLSFKYGQGQFELKGKYAAQFTKNQIAGYGIQFWSNTVEQHQSINKFIHQLEKSSIPRQPPKRYYCKDFVIWIKKLLHLKKRIVD